jgi:hypothetical protein
MSKSIRIFIAFLIALAGFVSSIASAAKLEGDYSGAGKGFFEKLSFRPDGSPPLVLMRKGNTLEGAPPGESVKLKFVKQ